MWYTFIYTRTLQVDLDKESGFIDSDIYLYNLYHDTEFSSTIPYILFATNDIYHDIVYVIYHCSMSCVIYGSYINYF